MTLNTPNAYNTVDGRGITLTNNGTFGSGSISTASTTGYYNFNFNRLDPVTSPLIVANTLVSGSGSAALFLNINSGAVELAGSIANSGNVPANVNNGATLILAKGGVVNALGNTATVNSGGTLQLAGPSVYQIVGPKSVSVNSGGVFDLNGQTQNWNNQAGNLSLNGTGIGSVGGLINSNTAATGILTNSSAASIVTLAGASSIGGPGNISIYGGIAGNFGLTKVGTGTLTLFGANTYSGDTTISSGTLMLATGGTLASSTTNIIVASGAGFDVSTPTTPLTLGSGQTLKASATGANTTGTITVGSGKNLTLGNTTTGLAFTAYAGGATPPLTVTGTSAGALDLNGKPVTVTTTTALAAGTYKLIAKSGSATVTGTPGTLTWNGSGSSGVVSGATPTLQVVSGELWLYVPSISTSGSLSALTTIYGAASSSSSVTVSAVGLSVNLTATAPSSSFQVSSDNSTWGNTATFTQSGGSAGGTLYVRLAATAAASTSAYNSQNTVLSSTGAATVNVATTSSGNAVSTRPITVTAAANSKQYDGTPTAAATPTGNALQNGDVVTSGESYDNANIGTTHTLTPATVVIKNAALTVDETANYTITPATIATGVITARPITITAQPNTKIFSGDTTATNVPTLTAGTLASGDGFATLAEHYLDAAVGTGKTVIPSATITNSAATDVTANYAITPVNDTSSVILAAQAATSLLLTNSVGVTNYYGQTLVFTAVVQTNSVTAANASSNVVFSLGSTPVWTNTMVSGVAYYTNDDLTVGVTNFTAQYLGDSNYLGSSITVTQTVRQTTPSLTLTASTINYGQTLTSSSLTGSVATNGYDADADGDEAVTGSFAFADNTIAPNAGVTNVWVIFTPTDSTNYTTASNTVNVTVNKANSTVTVTGSTSFTYDGAGQGPATASVTGSGGLVSYSYSGTGYGPNANTPTNAGSYTVTATVAADDNHYSATSSPTAFNISPAPASVTADAKTKTYGTLNPPLTATVVGQVIGGDTVSYSLSTDASQYSAVGMSNILVTLGSNPNYSVSATNGTLSIYQANTFVGATSTKNPSGYKDTVSYIATYPTDATGNVVYSSTNGPISTNAVSSGIATSLSITNLPRGTNVITVAYLGDDNYVGSTTNLGQIVTNHPPEANVMTVTRTAGLALMIKLSDIATNWNDVDGDTVELTSVTMQSTNGINLFPLNWSTNLDGSIVTTNGYAYIGYTNSPNVNDQISYGISDGFGGTNIGYVNIVIQGSVTGTNSITAYNFTSPGSNTVTAYGIPYFSYILERSTNLSSPVWVDVQTNQAAPNGVINMVDLFMDLGGVKPSPAFYQLKWQP